MHILSAEAQIFIPMAQPILSIFFFFFSFFQEKVKLTPTNTKGSSRAGKSRPNLPFRRWRRQTSRDVRWRLWFLFSNFFPVFMLVLHHFHIWYTIHNLPPQRSEICYIEIYFVFWVVETWVERSQLDNVEFLFDPYFRFVC